MVLVFSMVLVLILCFEWHSRGLWAIGSVWFIGLSLAPYKFFGFEL